MRSTASHRVRADTYLILIELRLILAGKEVIKLDYEAYVPLAMKTLHQILLEARKLPPCGVVTQHGNCHPHVQASTTQIELTRIAVHHLLGPSPPLTASIVICVSSPHRKEAFVACEWILEEVKKRVQIWKREVYADGTNWQGPDGQGELGIGGKSRPVETSTSAWKENFPPAQIAK